MSESAAAASVAMPTSSQNKNTLSKKTPRGLLPLVMCAVGICSFYLCYGVLQEELFARRDEEDSAPPVGATFLLTSQAITNTLFSFVWTRVVSEIHRGRQKKSIQRRRLNHALLFATSVCYVVAMTCSNESLRFVSYPTAVLMKSSKLIPIMILGRLVERRRYMMLEWVSAIFISTGVVLFHLSRMKPSLDGSTEKPSSSSSWYGMGLLSLSLFMDGLLGACQGILKSPTRMTTHSKESYVPPTAMETMLFVNFYAVILWLPCCIYLEQWTHGIQEMKRSSQLLYGMLGLNVCASLGQVFVFTTITWYNSLTCTTITTTRKFFTILLSVLHFGHKFTMQQWCSVALVFGGLYTSVMSKKQQTRDDEAKSKLE